MVKRCEKRNVCGHYFRRSLVLQDAEPFCTALFPVTVLEYANIPYKNDLYELGDDMNRDVWLVPKAENKWKLDFPKLANTLCTAT